VKNEQQKKKQEERIHALCLEAANGTLLSVI
jgi:hypothetical protein